MIEAGWNYQQKSWNKMTEQQAGNAGVWYNLHRLWESLSTGTLAKSGVETERLHDWQVCLDGEERSSWTLLLGEDVTSSAGKDTVDTTHGALWNLNLDQEDWLEESWLGKKGGGVKNTTSSWDDLSTTSVDGISVKSDIHDVEADASHGLYTLVDFPSKRQHTVPLQQLVLLLMPTGNQKQQNP